MGRCPDCGQWNTMVEEHVQPTSGQRRPWFGEGGAARAVPIAYVPPQQSERIPTGWIDLDNVLGGGLVRGSVVLIGGDPGIGKSTLLLQMGQRIAQRGYKILYLSGEESPQQIKMRAERLSVGDEGLYVLCEPNLERASQSMTELEPSLVVVDSIQTLYTDTHPSVPGSVGQLRETTAWLTALAKSRGTTVVLVGHVTKDGALAGPKVLEHMVDAVLYLEGERNYPFRILRAVKNRFGSTEEVCIMEMRESGLEQVSNPSERFLQERPRDVSGSVVVAAMEGSRAVLVEVQALVAKSTLGMPRRTTMGVDSQRVALLVAVLEKRAGLNLADQDIYVNVAGGMRISETAVDLGVVGAIASSYLNRPVDHQTVVFGEVGLTGEIRAVHRVSNRLKEAVRMDFRRCVMPSADIPSGGLEGPMELVGVDRVDQLLERMF